MSMVQISAGTTENFGLLFSHPLKRVFETDHGTLVCASLVKTLRILLPFVEAPLHVLARGTSQNPMGSSGI